MVFAVSAKGFRTVHEIRYLKLSKERTQRERRCRLIPARLSHYRKSDNSVIEVEEKSSCIIQKRKN